MYPKARLDALHDGVFSVAMTLLVLDVRLPDDFHPADGGELLQGLLKLWPKFLPYLLSFTVLGLRWLASIQIRSGAESFNREYVNWWLFYLLLIALISMRMVALTPELERGDRLRRRTTSALFLALSSLLTLVLSFVSPGIALWALALNFAQPVIERWRYSQPRTD